MGYSAEQYRAAKDAIDRRRRQAIAESEDRRAALHKDSPEIAEIDVALSKTGAALFRAALEGGREGEAFRRVMEENKTLREVRSELLASLGLPADYTEVHYACPACGDTGYVDIHMCDCLRRELAREGLRLSGLGSLVRTQSFESFSLSYYEKDPEAHRRMKRNLKIARDYAATFSRESESLLFFGRTGLGKTHLSTAIAEAVIEKGFSVQYDSAANIFEDFTHDRFKNARDERPPRADKYYEADLLIIDDLGAEATTQLSVSFLYNLLNSRINDGLPTIINTNMSEDELLHRYDDRITSRILGEFRPITFVGEDVRRQKLDEGVSRHTPPRK